MSREVIASLDYLNQVGPDDYRVVRRTKIFQSTAAIDEITEWAQTIGLYTINDITITAAE